MTSRAKGGDGAMNRFGWTWVLLLALVVGVAAPLRAEDDGGAPAPQAVVEQAPPAEPPAVVASPQQPVVEQPQGMTEWHSNLGEGEKVFHSQEDADAYSRSRGVVPLPPGSPQGVYGEGGVYLGKTMDEVQAKEQARLEAFAATHPAPADGSGMHDIQGRYLGENMKEAAQAGNIQYDPTSPEEIEKQIQSHGTKNIYLDEDTWGWTSFGANGKHGVTREEFEADREANLHRMFGEEARATLRQGRGELGPQVDAQMDATVKQAEQAEKEGLAELAKEKERLQKLIPRSLISIERGSEQK